MPHERFIDNSRMRRRAIHSNAANVNKTPHTGLSRRLCQSSGALNIRGHHLGTVQFLARGMHHYVDVAGQSQNMFFEIQPDPSCPLVVTHHPLVRPARRKQ
jgi:hypothetical protein